MRKIISIVILIFFANTMSFAKHPAAERISRDSMRTKWIDGKKFLVHKVAKGETFYRIARDYKIDVKDLMNANKGVTSLKTGQIIQVPVPENFIAPAKQTEEVVKETDDSEVPAEETKVVAQEKPAAKAVSANLYHNVKKGETLSAIARKYNVPASEIASLNNLKKNQINIGQKLIIKKESNETITNDAAVPRITEPTIAVAKPEKIAKQSAESNTSNIYHTVTKGETLYGISKKYGVSSKDVEVWNDMKNKGVKIGQKLIVKKETASASTIQETVRTKAAEDTMDQPKTAEIESKVENVKVASKEAEVKTPEMIDQSINTTVIDKTPTGKNVKQAIENGEAAWVNDADLNPNKYFALHRSAPIGTIMKVTNRMNGKYVFVKVIGKLPGTGDNDKLIIKISKAAADRLSVLDQTFQCELNYAFAVE